MICRSTYLKDSDSPSCVGGRLASELLFLSVWSPSEVGSDSVSLPFVEGPLLVLEISTKVLYPWISVKKRRSRFSKLYFIMEIKKQKQNKTIQNKQKQKTKTKTEHCTIWKTHHPSATYPPLWIKENQLELLARWWNRKLGSVCISWFWSWAGWGHYRFSDYNHAHQF